MKVLFFLFLLFSTVFGFFYGAYRILKFIFNLFFGEDKSKKQSPKRYHEQLVVKAFVAMAKLTPNYHVDRELTFQIRKNVNSAFSEMWKVCENFPQVQSIMAKYDEYSQKGYSIKVSDLQNELGCLQTYDFQYKKQILIGLLSIAYVNGSLDESQDKLIKIVKDGIGITDFTIFNRIQKTFFDGLKSGKYGDYIEFGKRRDGSQSQQSYNQTNQNGQREYSDGQHKRSDNQDRSSGFHISKELEKAFAILELMPDASEDDIKRQKRDLLKKYHPDLYANQGEAALEEATRKSQEINQAYDLIRRSRGF